MPALDKRPNTALVIVDVQNEVVTGAHARDAVVATIASLVGKARRERVPVIWVQHFDDDLVKGSEKWRIVPELVPGDAEPLIEKSYGDAFEETGLEAELARLNVGRLIVTGAQTDACIRSTLHGALVRVTTRCSSATRIPRPTKSAWGWPSPDQVIAHTNLYWTYQAAPGRTAGTVTTQEVNFSAR